MFIPQLDHCGSWLGNLTLTSAFFFHPGGTHQYILKKRIFVHDSRNFESYLILCGHQMKTTDKLLLKDN